MDFYTDDYQILYILFITLDNSVDFQGCDIEWLFSSFWGSLHLL